MELLAELLNLDEPGDVRIAVNELISMAEAGTISEDGLQALDEASDLLDRLTAFDDPWVFGHRYMSHKFVSTDPVCMNCQSNVPHRTMIFCPTCGAPGPWVFIERKMPSSYVHYLIVEMVRRIVNSDLILENGINRADGMVSAIPRGGAKSTWLAEITSEWLLATKRSRCLLILSNTITQVIERAVEIKTEFEENELLRSDFGPQDASRQDRRKWSQDDFVLANGSRLVARGAMQSMRGVKNRQYRPDVVISDDSDEEKYLTTPDQARKLWGWWDSKVVPACAPQALYLFHGTVLGEMALLWRAMTKSMGGTFERTTIRALEDRVGCSTCGMPASDPGPFDCPVCSRVTEAIKPCSFWGARFTPAALDAIRKRIGHWAWQSEFQQEPHDDSTSWFQQDWLDRSHRDDLAPLDTAARRLLPWSIISCSLTGDEAVRMAEMADPMFKRVPGDLGPYQVIVNPWDPAWARAKPNEQKTAWMAGLGMGLTWDDKLDIFFIDRARGKNSNSAYRQWMYEVWRDHVMPINGLEVPGQLAMPVESNGAGTLFQYGIEEHWGSIPMTPHQTGTEKHDLIDGIPGMASWWESGKVIIRAGGDAKQRELAEELIYELKHSGRSQYKDMLMACWIGWAYINRWIRDIRDPARYEELMRRNQSVPTRTTTH